MPSVEMKLEEMERYISSTAVPEDFGEYWDRALRELQDTPEELELKPAGFLADGVECFDMYFTGVRNARIHAKILIPKGKSKCPAVLQYHGYCSHSGSWWDKLAYVSQGMVVAAMDCRGQGGSSEDVGGVTGSTVNGHIIRGLLDGPDELLFRHIFLDTVRMAQIIMELPMVDKHKICTMGGSQGGGLALACASLVPQVYRVAADFPFLCDYKRVWDLNYTQDGGAYAEIRTFFRDRDPLHLREDEIFRNLAYIDVQNLTDRIRGDTVMAITLRETICPPSAQFGAFNKIRAPKRKYVYPDFGHEAVLQHNDTVFEFLCGRE